MARQKTMFSQKMVWLDPELNRQLADFRFESRFKSEAEAIRALMRRGLASLQKEEEVAALAQRRRRSDCTPATPSIVSPQEH